MKKNSKRIINPVIVMVEGCTYRLVKQDVVKENDPCKLCELEHLCEHIYFEKLCTAEGRGTEWYFEHNEEICDLSLNEIYAREQREING